MTMICYYCEEDILPENRADIITLDAHKECALREVLGGIGHHLDHAHFCKGELGPDAAERVAVASEEEASEEIGFRT